MQAQRKPSFLLLFLLISFGSITAVSITPALPAMARFFGVGISQAGLTISLFLIGYTVGQLLYGPLSNRYGRKAALCFGISLEIISSLLCALSGAMHAFYLLIAARLLMALGASVGLKMSFTLVSDCYDQKQATKIISHLMVAFAVTPAFGVAVGGFLTEHISWQAVFYFMAIYGLLLLFLSIPMQESSNQLDKEALKASKIIRKYGTTLANSKLLIGALLMGIGTAFVYVFAALAPFIAMQLMGLNPGQYGLWNLLPGVGVFAGSQLSAYLVHKVDAIKTIFLGAGIIALGVVVMALGFALVKLPIFLFLPLVIIYVGLGLIYANASSIATSSSHDKANASAMMSFINMGVATLCVLSLGLFHAEALFFLPIFYCILVGLLCVLAVWLKLWA